MLCYSNTCEKIRTIRARITCTRNYARNIDFRYLKGYYVIQIEKQEDFISLRFLHFFGII